MSIATITRTTYVTPTSNATFLTMLDTAMGVAGFTLYDTKTIGTTLVKVYSIVLNPSASKGTVYLKFNITNTNVCTTSLMTAWNTGTNASTNESTATNPTTFSFTNLTTIEYVAINSDELKGVLLVQGTLSFLVGVVRPANYESWYDENQWVKAFSADNVSNIYWYSTTLMPSTTPFGWLSNSLNFYDYITNNSAANIAQLSTPNPFNGNKRQVRPIEFYHRSGYGLVASTSSDLIISGSNGIVGTGVDTLIADTGEYLYLGKASVSSAGLGVRIA